MSTRIFVRGLPPTFTDAELRAHFAKKNEVTDARLIPHRRIGYIGFKTPEDAQAAVKYFNKTYIRTSKIGVEIAKTVAETRESRPSEAQHQHDPRKRQKLSGSTATTTTQSEDGNGLKRKHDGKPDGASPPNKKLQEYLDVYAPGSKSNTWGNANHDSATVPIADAGEDDDEYVELPALKKTVGAESVTEPKIPVAIMRIEDANDAVVQTDEDQATGPVSDADWLRSKTSRLLDLTDDVSSRLTMADSKPSAPTIPQVARPSATNIPAQAQEDVTMAEMEPEQSKSEYEEAIEKIASTGRLFVRNLSYNTTEEDLRQHFSRFGELEEVHLPIDNKTQASKGFVYVLFKKPADAVDAFKELDQTELQGRLLHIIAASPKRETKLDEYAISKLPLKKQRELKRKANAATSQFSWNSLYMNADAVISSVAHKLGVSKADLLDPTSSSAAVKQAHAETHIIQETKAYFTNNGIDVAAFSRTERDDRIVLVKNFPFGTKADELRKLLGDFGELRQLLMPPAGTIAIAEFQAAPAARAAFSALSYRRFKDGVLFLEKGPRGLFTGTVTATSTAVPTDTGVDAKPSAGDLKTSTAAATDDDVTTLFIRNLSFTTSAAAFSTAFSALPGFLWARVKTKTDPKKPGQTLSMGFGFVGFDTPAHARAALEVMDGKNLDGHRLAVKIAHRGADQEKEGGKKAAGTKKDEENKTKIIIKNLPFEVTKADVRSLFGKYGTLRTLRMPKKLGNRTRGFAFAEFVTAREAGNAMEALKDTHLLGRRLVLDYAQTDANDAEEEIERMTKKAGAQSEMVELHRLREKSKAKVVLDESGAVDDMMD
ncbi:putative pre-rRNA processing protein Mrd1 [Tricharina praecox]|uniref:putative pre-rRNA processing protein Mrd1 n=1 Tax=Tricharina praecox TaxID=43433 RepID=UPI002220D5DE|nr:putative pre-rRNA processing protein Mrd1 [Tricharina praecox]KAI5850647.1 putative pre-rRNA processing protein Mrd1 [Tricharina praecox]